MGFSCGIVGLPNVGKSTLFNALTATAAAQAENYPFCTIEPNLGEVAVPDARLEAIAPLAKSAAIVPTRLAFVDIAGLVRGASRGEGLGNQFLANIREADARSRRARARVPAGRQARTDAGAQERGGKGLSHARPAHGKARGLRVQCGRGACGGRKRVLPPSRVAGRSRGGRMRADLGQDR